MLQHFSIELNNKRIYRLN